MEFIIDESGAPAAKFAENRYISVLPVTRYQFERFIWQAAPKWYDYEERSSNQARISPTKLTPQNMHSLIITGLSAEEASEYASHFRSRLPTGDEWDSAYDQIFKEKNLFKKALDFMNLKSGEETLFDQRIRWVIDSLTRFKVTRDNVNTVTGEIVAEFTGGTFGQIGLRFSGKSSGQVMGQPSSKTPCDNYGFSVVFEG
jgi:hypothetical protein